VLRLRASKSAPAEAAGRRSADVADASLDRQDGETLGPFVRTLLETRLWWIRVGVVAAFAYLVVTWLARPWVGGDTAFVLDGSNAFLDCLSDGDLVACRHSGELDYWGLTSPIGDWPLLQHVPDFVSIGLGADAHDTRELVFVVLSVAGVVGAVALAWLVLRRIRQPAWFWGFLLVVLSGPLLVYARTTAGEALATGLLVCLVAAAVVRAPPPVIALAALGASLTKETSYPFIVALGVLGLVLASRRTELPIRRHLVWGAGGVAGAIVAASLFNVVRFGNVVNTNYLEPELHTPGVIRPLEYAFALVLSPNGGMLVYWVTASTLLLTACLLPLAFRSALRLDVRPALVLIAVIVALTLGFAAWWDPFGSVYGPRLTIPWILPLVLLALVAYGRSLGALAVRLLGPPWRLCVVFAVVFAFSLPHVGHLWEPEATGDFFNVETTPCEAPWREPGGDMWHSCQHERLWFGRTPMPLYSLQGVASVGGIVTSAVLAMAFLGCLVLLRDGLPHDVRRDEPRPPE
jgi:hypothetical protein